MFPSLTRQTMERKPLQSPLSDGFNDKAISPSFYHWGGATQAEEYAFRAGAEQQTRVMRPDLRIRECEQPIIVNLQQMKCISMCERGSPVISWGRGGKMTSIDFRKRQNIKKDGWRESNKARFSSICSDEWMAEWEGTPWNLIECRLLAWIYMALGASQSRKS